MNILVIGEICLDKFIYGKVSRLCPEAPVPVFNPMFETTNPGMAGNVVENIKAICTDCNIIFWHQKDQITKERIVDYSSNQMIVRIDIGENNLVETLDTFDEDKIKTIQNSDLVIVSDYNKGFLTENRLLEIASHSKISILDTKKIISEQIVDSFTFVKFNEKEGHNNSSVSNKSNVIVTLGINGTRIGNTYFPQMNKKETSDVSGAGDTFVAAFGIHYLKTNDLIESINFANKMAGIVVSKRGVATP